ncbi:MAG: hypothetical protein QMB96_05060 [Acinetobacter towneri]|nr:hypothetical protein DSM16313_26770 [Acinetobacter seohaensis]
MACASISVPNYDVVGVGAVNVEIGESTTVGAACVTGEEDEPPPPQAVSKRQENILKGKIFFIIKKSILR